MQEAAGVNILISPQVLGVLSDPLCLSFAHCTFLPGFQNLGMDSTLAAKITT